MNQDIKKSRDECLAMVNRMVAAARASQNATDMFDESVGKLFGSNRTDARCADIVQRHGRITAGHLAEQSGLTTGAVTTVIDRLETSGFVQRVRDEKDRRRVYVELTDYAKQVGEVIFTPISDIYNDAMRYVPIENMRTIAEYLEFVERVNRRHTTILQNHLPNTDVDHADRLQRARSFARDSASIATELVDTWGKEPDMPPMPGKWID
jgi:DNA-binding MarR family transcriptional regulator